MGNFGGMRTAPDRISKNINLAANFATTGFGLHLAEFNGEVVRVEICPSAAVATQAANFFTIDVLKHDTTLNADRVVATYTNNATGGTALAANTPLKATVVTTEDANSFPYRAYIPADYLWVRITPNNATVPAVNLDVLVSHIDNASTGRGSGSV